MASREALEAGRRLEKRRQMVAGLYPRDHLTLKAAFLVLLKRFERAAIRVGEVRERGRRSRKGGAR